MTPDIEDGRPVVSSGTCRSCGRDLVSVVGSIVRVYHPWNALRPGDYCAALIPIGDSGHFSADVDSSQFISEAEMKALNERIDAIHGPGASAAIDAAYEDGSIFSNGGR